MSDLREMITAQCDLQVRLGYDCRRMTLDERAAYIRENALALTDEVHEALAETGWKTWATSRHLNIDAYLGELRDAFQFLVNLMSAAEPDPAKLTEWFVRSLAEKQRVNVRRADAGYDGVTSKCTGCHRALDEIVIIELPGATENNYVCKCGALLPLDVIQPYLGS